MMMKSIQITLALSLLMVAAMANAEGAKKLNNGKSKQSAKTNLPIETLLKNGPVRAVFVERQGKDVSSGTVAFGQQGMRWERTIPYQETLIANTKEAWQVDHDLNQAIRLDPRALSAWAALFDSNKRSKHYTQVINKNVVELRRNKNASEFMWPNLDITTDAKGRIKTISFPDEENHVIELSGWASAKNVSFDYKPPPGMDIYGNP